MGEGVLGPALAGFALGIFVDHGDWGAECLCAAPRLARRICACRLVLTCAISDAILITLGVAGFGVLIAANPTAIGLGALCWCGVSVCLWRDELSLRR